MSWHHSELLISYQFFYDTNLSGVTIVLVAFALSLRINPKSLHLCEGLTEKNGFVTATKLGTTNKFFVAATKNFAAATKRFVVVTKYF